MDLARRILRSLGYSVWVTASCVLALLAGVGFIGSVSESSYDAHTNRAPEGRIAIAALALVIALSAIWTAIRRLRGKPGRVGLGAGLMLTATAALLILLLIVVELASGPL